MQCSTQEHASRPRPWTPWTPSWFVVSTCLSAISTINTCLLDSNHPKSCHCTLLVRIGQGSCLVCIIWKYYSNKPPKSISTHIDILSLMFMFSLSSPAFNTDVAHSSVCGACSMRWNMVTSNILQVIGNFKKSLRLADRHQHYMCYQMIDSTKYMKPQVSYTGGNSIQIDNVMIMQ